MQAHDSRKRRAAQLLAENHTLAATAEAVGVSERTIRRWRDAGDLEESAPTPDTQADIEADAAPHQWSRKEAELRKQIALARKHELEVDERLGNLVDRIRRQLDEEYGWMLTLVRRGVANIEGRWSPLLSCGCRAPREVAALLRPLVRELLEHLSGPVASAVEAGAEDLSTDFPGRAALGAAGVDTLSDLLAVEDLRSIRGVGPVTEAKIKAELEKLQRAD